MVTMMIAKLRLLTSTGEGSPAHRRLLIGTHGRAKVRWAANGLLEASQKVLIHVGVAAHADSATSGDSGKNTNDIRLRTEEAVCCDHLDNRKPMGDRGHRYSHGGEAAFISALCISDADVSDRLRYSHVGIVSRSVV